MKKVKFPITAVAVAMMIATMFACSKENVQENRDENVSSAMIQSKQDMVHLDIVPCFLYECLDENGDTICAIPRTWRDAFRLYQPCGMYVSFNPTDTCYIDANPPVAAATGRYDIDNPNGGVKITSIRIKNYASTSEAYSSALTAAATAGYITLEEGITIKSSDSITVANEYNDPGTYPVITDGDDLVITIMN